MLEGARQAHHGTEQQARGRFARHPWQAKRGGQGQRDQNELGCGLAALASRRGHLRRGTRRTHRRGPRAAVTNRTTRVRAPLRTAIAVGIGLFLALIALKSAGIVAPSKATYITLGDLHHPQVVLAAIGFVTIVALDRLKVPGAILIGILLVTVLSFFFGGNTFAGVFSAPPSIAPTFFALDLKGATAHGLLNVVLVFFLVELFDATGTLMGVAKRAGLLVPGKMDRMNKALLADSGAIFAGSLLGTSSTTAYIESAAGVQAGGRTGLTAITVAVLFLACLTISPLAGAVPAYATAPALFFVACLMLRELVDLDWNESTEVVPAAVTALAMPFTYSIANGLAFGFITYAAVKLFTGRVREVHWMVWLIALVFLFKFIWIGGD